MVYNSKRNARASEPAEAERRFSSFRWLDSSAEYQAAAGLLTLGVIPLLAPAARRRLRRWEEILRWYGLEPYVGGVAPTPPTDVEPDGTDFVVGFDDEYRPAAALLAAATGRRLVVAPNDDPLRPLRESLHAGSAVFAGRPHNLRKENVHTLARSLEIPWGVLTASDLPAMSFLLAKQLANRRAADGGALLLTAQSFTHMVVHAHGEGAHANLKSAVLCGLLGEAESWRGGALLDGCRQVRAKRYCKRASRQRRHIFSFGDLRARNVYLLSCNGFTTVGELYPTDVSAVLSAAEGYPATVVTSDRSLGIETRLPALALCLSSQGVAAAAICQSLNRIMMFRYGVRPFVLCGDPLGADACAPAEASNGDLSVRPREAARLIDLKGWEAAPVIGLAKDPPGISLFRGEGSSGALLSDGTKRRRVKLEDFSARWQARSDRIVTLARRGQALGRATTLIKDFWWEKYRAHADFREMLEELAAAGRKLLTATQRSLRGLENIRCEGVWSPRVEILFDAAERHAGEWDECFARVIEGHILDWDLARLLLHDGLQTADNSGERCQRCGMELVLTEATDYVDSCKAAAATDCPNCGPQEFWQVGGVRFAVKGKPEIHPGRLYGFSVEARPTAGQLFSETPSGYVVAQFQDLGGKPFWSEIAAVKNGKTRFRVPVPRGCPPDMQTLWIAWVQGVTVSAWRLQYACVPAGGHRS
ncbi:MAG: hypothetical protein LC800_21625 [Acidobacteria bacterium]|nr:hypothetical protein [Acidobacteriota bacterium]